MSLRTRLTVLYTCALALVLAISAILIGRIQLRAMNQRFDERLVSGAGVVDYAVRDRVSDAGLQAAAAQLLVRLHLADLGIAIGGGDGARRTIFTGSDPELAHLIPAGPCREAPTTRRILDNQSYRLLVRCVSVGEAGTGLTAVIGAPEASLIQQRRRLLNVFALTMLMGLALTAVGGHWMSGKTIAPIRDMTSAIQQIDAEQLGERLPVRPGDGEIAELSRVINALFDRLSTLVTRERRFLANAAHALRTPVAVLRAEVSEAVDEIGRTGQPSGHVDAGDRQMTEIADSVDHLGRTVEYLLSLARRDSGIEIPSTERLYLDDVASGTVARLGRLFTAREVAVQWGRLEETPVLANPHIADQVLQILLENAAQYCPPGSTVTVSVHPADSAHGELAVEDNGPGLTPADRETLFTPFVRGSAARDTGTRGTGLGLAVAQWLVESVGGVIGVETRQPRGTRVVVRFPLSP